MGSRLRQVDVIRLSVGCWDVCMCVCVLWGKQKGVFRVREGPEGACVPRAERPYPHSPS